MSKLNLETEEAMKFQYSIPCDMYQQLKTVCELEGYDDISDYINHIIEMDLEKNNEEYTKADIEQKLRMVYMVIQSMKEQD